MLKINVSELKDEYQIIKEDFNDFGANGFYNVKLKSFESEFPNFFKVMVKYLSTFDINELDNEYWQSGELVCDDDWPALFAAVELILRGITPQYDKCWAINGYKGV